MSTYIDVKNSEVYKEYNKYIELIALHKKYIIPYGLAKENKIQVQGEK